MHIIVGWDGIGSKERIDVELQCIDEKRRCSGFFVAHFRIGAISHDDVLTLFGYKREMGASALRGFLGTVGLERVRFPFAVDVGLHLGPLITRGVVVIGQQRVQASRKSADDQRNAHFALRDLRSVIVGIQSKDSQTVAGQLRVFLHAVLPPFAFQCPVGLLALDHGLDSDAVHHYLCFFCSANSPGRIACFGQSFFGPVTGVVDVNALCLASC